jgi:hypothetical protein
MLAKTVRAHQLYEGRSPSYDRFVAGLREGLAELWENLPSLVLDIDENSMSWEGHEVYRSEQRVESLAFIFFRDGIRQIILLPGFEESELEVLLRILAQVHRVREDQDDLLTLLWEADLGRFRYRHVELAMEGLDIPVSQGQRAATVDAAQVRADAERREERGWASSPAAQPESALELSVVLQEPGHVLEPRDMDRLAADLRRELGRNLWPDVVNGLIDRLEDGQPDRQRRVVLILTEMLPGLISGGQIAAAALLLRELTNFVSLHDARFSSGQRETEALFEQLSEPHTVEELIRSVEDAPEAFPSDDLAELLGHFPAAALAPLIAGIERVIRPEVRRALESAVSRLAERHQAEIVVLLGSPDAALAAGAARLAGRVGIPDAAGPLSELLARPQTEVRLAAVAALQELRASTAAAALVRLLDDAERDVRIAAARAIGSMRYPPARTDLERLLTARRLREADVTERLAVFEAYGSVAGPEGIPTLDHLLNGRGWLGRKAPVEFRASAALALGRIAHPAARDALRGSAEDPDPVVRSAVSRGLRAGRS